jgi:hypothetical protein
MSLWLLRVPGIVARHTSCSLYIREVDDFLFFQSIAARVQLTTSHA